MDKLSGKKAKRKTKHEPGPTSDEYNLTGIAALGSLYR